MNQEKKLQTSSTVPKTYKRQMRNVLIHRPMQREFSLVLVALMMISTLAIGFVIHETIREAAFGGGFRFGKINPYEVLSEVRYQLILRVSCVLFVTLVVIGLFAVFFLHRIAGPLYRIRQIIYHINNGEMPLPIRLREGDYFMDVATEMNQLLQKLKGEQERAGTLKQKLDQILGANPGDEIASKIRELKSILKQAEGS